MTLIVPLDQRLRALRTIQSKEHLQRNEDETAYRISSAAFQPGRDNTLSVDLEESLLRKGLGLDARYPSLPRSVALVAHTVAEYEAATFTVRHDPIPENEHHGAASTDLKKGSGALRKVAREMAEKAQFVVPIDPVAAQEFGAEPLQSLSATRN